MSKRRKKNAAAVPIGVIIIILAVVGLVAVVKSTVNFISDKADNTKQMAEYEQMLKPVVMFDPDTFDDLTQANKSQLLYSAIWSLLEDENGMSKYQYSKGDTVGILVPQTDIETAFINLYGNEIDIASLHSQIDMSGYDITYDPAQKGYILPITGVESVYIPKVYSLEKQGSSVILNVGYIGSKAWADISGDEYVAPEPDKYMKITLRERSGGMYISSIQAADSQEIASQFINTTTVTQTVTESEADISSSESSTQAALTQAVTDENGNTITTEAGDSVTVTTAPQATYSY